MPGLVPAVIARRRVTLIDSGLPRQPYEHESTAMREDEANALIARRPRDSAAPVCRPSETVAAVWKSYRLQCAADGMLYQLAICRAARQLGLDVHMCRRGEEISWAAEQLGVTLREVEEFVSRAGRPVRRGRRSTGGRTQRA